MENYIYKFNAIQDYLVSFTTLTLLTTSLKLELTPNNFNGISLIDTLLDIPVYTIDSFYETGIEINFFFLDQSQQNQLIIKLLKSHDITHSIYHNNTKIFIHFPTTKLRDQYLNILKNSLT